MHGTVLVCLFVGLLLDFDFLVKVKMAKKGALVTCKTGHAACATNRAGFSSVEIPVTAAQRVGICRALRLNRMHTFHVKRGASASASTKKASFFLEDRAARRIAGKMAKNEGVRVSILPILQTHMTPTVLAQFAAGGSAPALAAMDMEIATGTVGAGTTTGDENEPENGKEAASDEFVAGVIEKLTAGTSIMNKRKMKQPLQKKEQQDGSGIEIPGATGQGIEFPGDVPASGRVGQGISIAGEKGDSGSSSAAALVGIKKVKGGANLSKHLFLKK
jgi:hypothetical protein